MFATGVFDLPSWLIAWFYGLTHNYGVSIALIAVVVMVITAPLTLKSTKGMLEMQRLAPEMKKLQAQYRNDRTKLNEEMMKLYQEHKVNPLSSCLPLLAQMPVFIIMFRVLYGLTYRPSGGTGALAQGIYASAGRFGEPVGFLPRYISHSTELFQSLVGQTEMVSFGLDLAKSPFAALGDNFATGLIYLGLVAVLGVLYFVQQRMVAARAAVSPTMSPSQQKLMQYLPVAFAVFQVFFVLGLVIYYISQAILRIGLQHYITRAFYGHDEALGRQAQRASEHAREIAKQEGDSGGGGLFAQARRDMAASKADKADKGAKAAGVATATAATAAAASAGTPRATKRTTEPKNRPTPSGNRPSGRPQRGSGGRPGGPRSKSSGKRPR
jgi:YidC/Oxa1 family membrane protein insertase